jgi:hypothetical protein
MIRLVHIVLIMESDPNIVAKWGIETFDVFEGITTMVFTVSLHILVSALAD